MTKGPLSPHWQIYRWQLTMLLSLTHRGTGIFLSLGSLLFAYWLLAVASGPDRFAEVSTHINAWYGRIILTAFIFSLNYHLCNGIRHIFWDVGLGFEPRTAYLSGIVVVLVTVILTTVTCVLGSGVLS